MNIKLTYLYRDGGNYKQFDEVVYGNPNNLSLEELEEAIRRKLIDGQWFIASDWKLPDLHFKEFSFDSEVDHDWHEFEKLEETLEEKTESITIDELLDIINKIKLPW